MRPHVSGSYWLPWNKGRNKLYNALSGHWLVPCIAPKNICAWGRMAPLDWTLDGRSLVIYRVLFPLVVVYDLSQRMWLASDFYCGQATSACS